MTGLCTVRCKKFSAGSVKEGGREEMVKRGETEREWVDEREKNNSVV